MNSPGTGSWSTPQGSWNELACESSSIPVGSVNQHTTYSSKIDGTVISSVTASIQAKTMFNQIAATESTRTSIANQFGQSANFSASCTVIADTMAQFFTGCIYQAVITMENLINNETLTFYTGFTGCSINTVPPSCPPMETCTTSSCTACENQTSTTS